MVRMFKYTVKATKEDDLKQCIVELLHLEECGYKSPSEVKGVVISYKKEKNAYLAEIDFDLYNEWTLMDLPNLWDSREDMLDTCKELAQQLLNCSFKIMFNAQWESAQYFQKGECMFTGKWIEYSDFGYTDEPPTYLNYTAVLANGQFCDEEKELLDESACPID